MIDAHIKAPLPLCKNLLITGHQLHPHKTVEGIVFWNLVSETNNFFMRPIWTGSIGFGLVNIPVRLYAATEESTLPFISMDKHNHARIRYKKVNEVTGKEVPYPDIVKGYKVGSEYVVVDDEDFQKALPEKTITSKLCSSSTKRK